MVRFLLFIQNYCSQSVKWSLSVSEAEDSDLDGDDSNLSDLNSEDDDGLKLQFHNEQTSTEDEDTEEISQPHTVSNTRGLSETPTPNPKGND